MLKLFKLLSNKRLFILLITLIMFIVLMGFSLGSRKALTWPENFVRDTVGFVQNAFYKPAGYVAGLFQDIANLKDMAEENKQMKITLAQYAREKAQYNFIKSEYEDLQEQLKFTEAQKMQYEYEYHIAQVVGLSTDPGNSTLVVNRGSRHGVQPNMTVISDKGMIGIVSQVSPFTSTVKLLTMLNLNDPNSQPAIAATTMTEGNVTFGMIESYDASSDMLIMNKIAPEDPIKEGDTIISSGTGGLYPRGMVIGTVEEVNVGEGLTRTALVKPAAEFQDWKMVYVVFTSPEAQAISDEAKQMLEGGGE